jgi:hypothetical protein
MTIHVKEGWEKAELPLAGSDYFISTEVVCVYFIVSYSTVWDRGGAVG